METAVKHGQTDRDIVKGRESGRGRDRKIDEGKDKERDGCRQ